MQMPLPCRPGSPVGIWSASPDASSSAWPSRQEPGGTVLDPFAGTGTTLFACLLEGMRAIGIEQNPACTELCRKRLLKASRPGDTGGGAP
jgi:DNA methylase